MGLDSTEWTRLLPRARAAGRLHCRIARPGRVSIAHRPPRRDGAHLCLWSPDHTVAASESQGRGGHPV